MKYRVRENCGKFYPQYGFLCFWWDYVENWGIYDLIINFETLEEARAYIGKKIKRNPIVEKYHYFEL